MSRIQANPLLYLNMGGEMLYVLRQRLKAQKITIDKSVQVMDEVSVALINPTIISSIFQQESIDLPAIRSSLERAVLSSIMRLDEASMGKLFDLMIMMVKYQISAVTGPRELLLVTLNHIDTMRDSLLQQDTRGHECLGLVHKMLIQLYGNYTYDQMWRTRETCLYHLQSYNVRVSILLRLGLQNDNGTFNLPIVRNYDERYEQQRNKNELFRLRLLENSCKACKVGSLEFIGDRVTNLGCNMYDNSSPSVSCRDKREGDGPLKGEPGSRAELGMLAIQLGSNDGSNDCVSGYSPKRQTRPFTLRLLVHDQDSSIGRPSSGPHRADETTTTTRVESTRSSSATPAATIVDDSNNQHRAKLDEIYGNFLADEEETRLPRKIELLELMDQLE